MKQRQCYMDRGLINILRPKLTGNWGKACIYLILQVKKDFPLQVFKDNIFFAGGGEITGMFAIH